MKALPAAVTLAFLAVGCSQTDAAPAPASSAPPAASSAPPVAAPTAPETPLEAAIDALYAGHRFEDVRLSSSGARVAWVESFDAPGSARPRSIVRVLDRKVVPPAPRTITAGASARHEHAPAWAPDGRSIAFVSDAEGQDRAQLYVASFDDAAAAPRKLTGLSGALDSVRFSPDGKTIAVLYTEGAAHPGPLEAVEPVSGEAESHVPVTRLELVDVATGEARALSRADLHVHEYDWSADGSRFAVVGSAAPGDAHWWTSKLYAMDAATGADRVVFTPPTQIAEPRLSPDGKSIAFIGGLMSDEGSTGGDVFVVPADGSGPARDLTPGMRASASSLAWPKGTKILFGATVDGATAIESVDLSGPPQVLASGADETLGDVSFSGDGALSAVVRSSFARPSELWAGEVGKWQQLTHVNDAMHPSWGEATSVHWKSDGHDVQGWLVAPAKPEPGKRAPMIVVVHGGPAAAETPAFRPPWALASAGSYLFLPNPRGSFGLGEAFTAANVKDFGHGDMRDVMAGIDAVERTTPVDDQRLMLYGWSYGGYMTMWMVTQTTRFRAAVAGAGIADWQSYWGQNAISDWLVPYFGATVYDDPRVYARSSPIEFIKRVKTPTLVMAAERDGECPLPQSQEFWRGLQAQGVDTKLVVYPGEGHSLRKPENRRDRLVRILKWFESHS
jgi:dipeptidyl aminopeptidase/acylaminoacyl peptidase